MEVLGHDVVESILERVSVKSLLRFKSVSKRWKSTIESKNFQETQMLIHRQQSPGPDLLFLAFGGKDKSSSSFSYPSVDDNDDDHHTNIVSSSIKIYRKKWFRRSYSCDGLICFLDKYESIIINPTTRWHRTFPPSNIQKQHDFGVEWRDWFGFGKDKFSGTYKSVWLYNDTTSHEFDKNKTITTCEVFDFGNKDWRYVTCPGSPYDILLDPVHLEGSLHWLIKCELDTQVLSFDLHTETFQLIAKAPFDFDREACCHYKICNLNNRLCLSETNTPNQVIWLFDPSSKTWINMCSIDLNIFYSWFRKSTKHEPKWKCSLKPLSVLKEKNEKKVLFYFNPYGEDGTYFVIYDVQTDSFDSTFKYNSGNFFDFPICFFQSLISIL